MKLAKFEFEGRTASGIVEGDHIRTIGGWFAGPAYDAPFDLPRTDLDTLLKTCDRVGTGEVVPIAQAVLAPPADHKTKIVCLGMNYKTHVAEVNTDIAPNPALFTRWLDTLVGHGQPLIRPQVSQCFDYEGELVVVIGLGGRHIPKDKAWGPRSRLHLFQRWQHQGLSASFAVRRQKFLACRCLGTLDRHQGPNCRCVRHVARDAPQ